MKFFSTENIRKADAYTIANEPVASIDLMERAASQLSEWITGKYSEKQSFLIFAGPGNNGGDGWALARLLWLKGFKNISLFLLDINRSLSPDSEINSKRLKDETAVPVITIKGEKDFPEIKPADTIIDSLFGSGLSRPLDGLSSQLIRYLNTAKKADVIAIDMPSGLFGEDNAGNSEKDILCAGTTLTFQFPKLSFFFPENAKFTGEWHVLPIGLHPEFIEKEATPYHYLTEGDAVKLLKIREKFSHKGTFGHALLIAGSYGMMGAAVLSARATLRAGVGLLTVHTPRLGVEIVQTSIPEALLSIDESDLFFSEHPSLEKYSAVGIGPGISQKSNTKKAVAGLLQSVKMPVIIDADGLNSLSSIENWQDLLPDQCILTPHPKEFERLFGAFTDSYSRMQFQKKFSQSNKCVIVLKGAHTCITTPDGKAWFNTSGNPGMATGGSGDVLTGMILGLLAQGYSGTASAMLGVYLHGLAGDLSARCYGQYGLIASDIIDNIGYAFCVIEKKKTGNEKI